LRCAPLRDASAERPMALRNWSGIVNVLCTQLSTDAPQMVHLEYLQIRWKSETLAKVNLHGQQFCAKAVSFVSRAFLGPW